MPFPPDLRLNLPDSDANKFLYFVPEDLRNLVAHIMYYSHGVVVRRRSNHDGFGICSEPLLFQVDKFRAGPFSDRLLLLDDLRGFINILDNTLQVVPLQP